MFNGWQLVAQQDSVQENQHQQTTLTNFQTHYALSEPNGKIQGLFTPAGELAWQAEPQSLWGLYLKVVHHRRHLSPLDPQILFAGQWLDNESGLAYNRFRYYDPETANYLTLDPIGLQGGETPYRYVSNPLDWVDLWGLAGCGKKWDIGSYASLRNKVKNQNLQLDAHHVGQKALMKKFIKNYDINSAPAILVPKVGHTISKKGVGVVSRKMTNSKGQNFKSARDVLARDIKELRRVYKDIPNKKLKELIELNKKMYPEIRG